MTTLSVSPFFQLHHALAGQTRHFAFQITHTGFAGVIADHIAQRVIGQRPLALFERVVFSAGAE